MKVLGVIPARGGSKQVPGKNIALVCGKPLIVYTIEAASKSKLLSRTVVSTDSDRIAGVCRNYGAEVPFVRPADLAQDDTPTLPVIIHALKSVVDSYDAVMILQPTSPVRDEEDIDAAIDLLMKHPEADSVISVVKVGDHHPARMKRIVAGVLIDPSFAEESEGQTRQSLPEYYLRNGSIYLTRTSVLIEKESLKGDCSLAYVMTEEKSVNVDSPIDLLLAEAVIRYRHG